MIDSEQATQSLNEALAHLKAGRADDAGKLCRRVLISQPQNAEAHHLLGVAELQNGGKTIALEHLQRAVQLGPGTARYQNTLGVAYIGQRKFAQGIHHFWRAVVQTPQYLDALKNLALALRDIGEADESHQILERAARLAPDSTEFAFLLCRALNNLERTDEAIEAAEALLARQPDHAGALIELGQSLAKQKRYDDAEAYFRHAVEIDSENAVALNGLGQTLEQQGDVAGAAAAWEKSLRLQPDAAPILTNLGIASNQLGAVEKARECLRKSIELAPNRTEAYLALSQAVTFEADDPVISQMKAVCEEDAIPPAEKVKVHFALGKAYEDLSDYEAAFEQFEIGNSLKKPLVPYDRGQTRARTGSLIEFFTEDRFAELAGRFAVESDLPIFVLGMPRSGTTLVEQILSSHPSVHGAGELNYLDELVEKLESSIEPRTAFPYCLDRIDSESVRKLAQGYVEKLRNKAPAAKRVSDKMPKNCIYQGLIALLWPNAKVIHCLRDPMDVCVSCYTRYFAKGQPFSWELTDLGHYSRQNERLAEHWRTVLPIKVYELRYEELVADQERIARELIAYCGLEWDDRCLQFHNNSRPVKTNPYQVRIPIYTSSVGRWKRYEAHVEPLKRALAGEFG